MSKKTETKKTEKSETPAASEGTAATTPAVSAQHFAVAAGNVGELGGLLAGFEDLSLPPIIKTAELKPGSIIIGKFEKFGKYEEGKIRSALITISVHDVNPSTKELFPVGIRAAVPVGAVLARALGTKAAPEKTPDEQITDIQANGYGVGTMIAMAYRGTGKERGEGKNRPHLWDIKCKRPDGAVTDNRTAAK